MAFFMILSLLASSDGISLETATFRIYSRNGAKRVKFPGSL
jgi:hypothetical protein